ncbi:hypothetical protein HN51_057415 [Arachis hypogaea]
MSAVNQSFRDQGMKAMQTAQSTPDPFGLLGLRLGVHGPMNLQRVIQSLMCHNVITQSSPLLYMRARLPFKVFGGNIVLHILQHAQRRSTIICFKLNEL